MINFIPISGTFLDGIACDIPSNNWTDEIWDREFARYQRDGIDTAIIIRVGFKDSAMYKSDVMKTTLYQENDLVQRFLDLGKKYHVKIYIGMFDTEKYWLVNDWQSEVAINIDLIHELQQRYGQHPAFAGWYMSHEGSMQYHQTKIWKPLCQEIRKLNAQMPIMTSPRYAGSKWSQERPISPKVHRQHFEYILAEMEGLINIYAPMDGHVAFKELEGYLQVMAAVTAKYNVEFWSNLETFDRDMPWRFPPIEWEKMRFKLERAQVYVSKIISFELPHFLSPDSMYPSAGTLYQRYHDYLQRCKKC
ncbi:MAG: DUF4434 domain-containing protein [Lentisphaeria bacterium]